jgi:glycosyltransferase involved in cell wall biosynthesis
MSPVSVALATYNGRKFLGAQLGSLAAQEVLPHDLVIADDGSSDDTLTIAHAFARSAPFPVLVLRSEQRLGYAANFIKAARACTGDLIAFSDQDDVWRRDKLRRMREVFGDPEVMLAYHNARLIDEAGREIGVVRRRRGKGRTYAPLAPILGIRFTGMLRYGGGSATGLRRCIPSLSIPALGAPQAAHTGAAS